MSIDDSTYGPGRRIYSFNSKGISFYTENRFLPMATRSFFIGYSNGRFTLSNAEPGHDYLEGYRVLLNRLEGLMDRVEAIYNFLIQSSQFNHYLLCEMVDSEVWNKWEKLVGTNFLEKNPIAISFDYKRVIAMNPFQKEESNVDIGAFLRSVSEKDKKIAELEAELARYRRGEAHRERNSDTPAVTLRLEDSIKDQSKIEEMLNGSVAEKVVPEKRKMRRPDYLKGNNPDFQIAMDKSRDALFGTRNIVKKFDLSLLSSELIYGLSPKVPIAKNELVNTQRTFTNREAAEMLKVSTRTLQEYRKKGLINCSQCERRVVYTQQDIDDYMNNHRS
jgi:hypothetical protein